MIYYFLEVDADGRVVQQHNVAWDGEGPPAAPVPMDANSVIAVTEPISFQGPTPTSEPYWQDGAMVWVELATLAELQAAAIDAIDTAADAARAKVLVKQTNNIEYQAALADAIKYRDAGFVGTAGPGVTTWTHAKRRQGWTDRDAAENILATAAVWEGALMFIRGLRLDAKEMVRDAATNAEVDFILATFAATLTAAMQGVQ